jgi:proline dehydrogenase
VPRVRDLARMAAERGMGFNIDAEEADRLALSLDVIEAVLADPSACRLGRLRRRGAGLRAARGR